MAIPESNVLYGFDAVGNNHRAYFRISAALVRNLFHFLSESERFDLVINPPIILRTILGIPYDTCYIGATRECPAFYACDVVGNSQTRQAGAIIECLISNDCDTVRDGYTRHTSQQQPQHASERGSG